MGTSRAVTRRDPGVRYPHYPPTRHLGARVLSKQLLNVHNRGKEDGSKKCCLCGVLKKAPEHLWARWLAQDDRPRTARRPRLWVWKQTSDIESKARGSTEGTLHACFHPSPSKSLVRGSLAARSGTLAKHLLGCAHQRMTGPTDREEKEKTGMEKPADRPTDHQPTD